MKHNNIIILLGLLLLSACTFLDEDPRGLLDTETAYSTETNLYLSTVANLYNYIGGNSDSQGLQGTYRGVYDFNTFCTDELMLPTRGGDWYDGGFWQRLFLHEWDPSDEHLLATWEYLYKVVVLCNESLGIIESSTVISDTQKLSWSAEVRSLRAMYYWYLCDMFGRVPLLTKSTDTVASVGQASRSEVARFISDELTDCIPDLPSGRSNTLGDSYGHMTQAVAWFILAKVALNSQVYFDDDWSDAAGADVTFTIDGTGMNAWESTVYCCEQITALGYGLDETPDAPFSLHNETSTENIFVIPMDRNLYSNQYQYHFRSLHYLHSSELGFSAENGTSATLETLSDFGYGTDFPDKRFPLTFFADTVRVNGSTVKLDDGTTLVYKPLEIKLVLTGSKYGKTAGARMLKYEIDPTATKDSKLQSNDIVLFRYADVLLMETEAKLRMASGSTSLTSAAELSAEALVLLTAVRSRAGMPVRVATLDNILKERKLELCCEGWRRQDMIRFGTFSSAYSDHPADSDNHFSVFPIPFTILTLNSGTLTQNPGY